MPKESEEELAARWRAMDIPGQQSFFEDLFRGYLGLPPHPRDLLTAEEQEDLQADLNAIAKSRRTNSVS